MRANVLTDPAFTKQAGQFARLSLDFDKPENAAFLEKFKTEGVPVFYVIDPVTEKAALSWYGTATAPQLLKLLADGRRALAGGGEGAGAALAAADRLNGENQYAEAAKAYQRALEAGGPDWPERSRTIESLVMAQSFAHEAAAAVATALEYAPSMPRDRSFVNTVYFGLDNAQPGSPELRKIEDLAEEAVKIPGVLADDTAQLYLELANAYRYSDKNETAAKRAAEAALAYVQEQIRRTATPESRTSMDSFLVSAAFLLGKPEIAIPELERSQRDFPADYNPPARLAAVYDRLGRNQEAITEIDRAIGLAYGARKANLYAQKASRLAAHGDKDAARRTLEQASEFAKTLPPSQASGVQQRIGKQLAQLK